MSNLPAQTTPVYCTDEDIAVRAGGDFVTLCPAWQNMATGSDGVFLSGTPWVLTSTAVNFNSNSIQPNQVVQLTGGTPPGNFKGLTGQLFAIDSVTTVTTTGDSLVLRRLHKDLNIGQPPGAGGLTAVNFTINTLDPQSEESSFDIKRRFGIDETQAYRASSWVFDLRDLRMATVLSVLYDRYTQETRADRGDFIEKIKRIHVQLEMVMSRVQVRWGPFGNSEPPSSVFNFHISR